MIELWEGIIIGGAGGAAAGIIISLLNFLGKQFHMECDKSTVKKWLSANVIPHVEKEFRSTRAIASHTNLTQDRIRYICSVHQEIKLSTGPNEDLWGLRQP